MEKNFLCGKKLKKIIVSSLASLTIISSIGIGSVSASTDLPENLQAELEADKKYTEKELLKKEKRDEKRAEKELKRLEKEAPEKFKAIQDQKQKSKGISAMASSGALGTNGDILITTDNKTAGYDHGHAAVVRWDTNYIVEAMPGGVRYNDNNWKNEYTDWWGLWVSGASGSDYDYTESYARGQVGEPYSILALKNQSSKWYCSLIPYKAWSYRGFNLDTDGGTHVTPRDILFDNDTIVFDKS
ncbi:distant relative of cell wall-associated hydrolase-like protein [Halobacillus litoralis]|uniref:Distant relative of cell wall-associated hydrolase-like protein n=1 Tax=Halobacillus litoralis TaxID=45668 RepID=A0A845E2B0_9BACI|nr:distant relative of cell wall-associated hydrolase-like protein [Halobacillus litoralis]MYL49887.1 distant relative of cell wall-associated hydrolase-like protein [Halobacillus litoralis]